MTEQNGDLMVKKWKFKVFEVTDGCITIPPFVEIKTEIRRQPKGLFNVIEFVANYAYLTNYFNITGEKLNHTILLDPHAIAIKKVKNFFRKTQKPRLSYKALIKKKRDCF
jgi:hypothetical protein